MTSTRRNGIRAATLAMLLLTISGCVTNTTLRQDGIIFYNRGDYAQARDHFDRATAMASNDYRSYYWLGKTELALDNPVAAQIALERALAIRSGDPLITPDILDALAEAYYQQGRYDNLAAFLQSATDDYGASRDFLRQGQYLAKAGDVDAARTALRKAAYFAAPGDAQPYLVIADFYRDLNDRANELVALRYAYWVNPGHRGLADRIRALGTVPGPTVALEPPKPELLR